jgi:hypothetical protein
MALVLKDRVKQTATAPGTGTITLLTTPTGFQAFSAVGNGNTTYFAIVDPTSGAWEVNYGTYTSSGTTLSRNSPPLSSSNSGSLVNFTGAVDVFLTYPSESAVWRDTAGVVAQQSFGAITATSAALTTGTVSTTPASNTDIANKQYVDGLVTQGISYHEPVYVESPNTAGNLTATYNQPGGAGDGVGATLTNAGTKAALTIDGILMTTTKRVLIYNQTNAYENGIYTVTTVGTPDPGGTNWVLTRSTDADTYGLRDPDALGYNDAFFVTNGNTGAGETYVVTTTGVIVFGTTNITFAQISSSQVYTAGTGLNLSPATTFNIANTGVTANTYGSASAVPVITVNAQGQATGITNTNIAINGTQVSGNISGSAGSVANALTLGTYLTGTSFNGSAAVTATVDATSANTASKVVARDASGDFSAGTITATLSGSSTSATTATNLAGGTANQIPYQTAAGTTAFTTAASGTNYVLNYTGSAFNWVAGTISGVALGSNLNALTAGTYLTSGGTYTGATARTFAVDATDANTASKVVARDASGNFSANVITAALTGNASTATNLGGGGAYTIVYQSAAGTTAYLTNGTTGQVLTANTGAAPTWAASGGNAYTRTTYTATSGQTSFSVTYTAGYLEVYLNGVLLTASDYTATNGTTVVLTSAAALNDIVEFIAFNTTAISNTTANNLLAGTAGQIVYQSAPDTTAFSAVGTSGQYLQSNGTGAPTWATPTVAPSPLTLSASANLTLPASSSQNIYFASKIITLDANRELVIYSNGSSSFANSISAFVYNSSTNTFGAVATIRTTAGLLGAILVSTDKVLVVSMGSSGTSLEAVVLSVSTNTITVNTAATATLAGVLASLGGNSYFGSLVTVGTSFVLSYGRATTVTALRAFTVSGTTVTIGSESTLTPATDNAAALFPISSSVVLALSSSATVFYATPYTVSGTTLTVGTGATTTLTNIFYVPAGVFQSGQIGVLFLNTTVFGGIVSVSGTTASISSAQVLSTTASLIPNNNYTAIIGDKMLCYYSAASNASLVNVLTNTSGTASAGTEITGGSASNALSQLGYINGNILAFGLNIPLKYSISGSNAIETVVDTYYAQATAITFDQLNNLGTRIWNGSSYISPFILRSATKTLSPFAVNSVYMNSDGTLTPTAVKLFGNSSSIIGNETNVCWFINYRSATTVTALKVTLS